MKIGKIEKVVWYVNGIEDCFKWVVTCSACLHIEQSVSFFRGEAMASKQKFFERLKKEGWFLKKNGRWQCGSHGTKEDNSAMNPEKEWREDWSG